jgi:hypothetical protein
MQLRHFLFEKPKLTWLSFLFENKLQDIRSKLFGKSLELFDGVTNLKPSLPSKYWQWIAKNYKEDNEYSKEQVHEFLLNFDELVAKGGVGLPSKDIYFYKNIESLENGLESANQQVSRTQGKKELKKDKDIVYSDNRYFVVQPKTTAAACYYGAGTKWCISARDQNQFENYTSNGAKFVIIIDKEAVKENPMAKVAIAYLQGNVEFDETMLQDRYEIYDSTDELRTIESVWENYPQSLLQSINDFFSPEDIIPVSQEKEQERIQSLSPAEINQRINSYLGILDGYITDKKKDNSKGIEYIKNYVQKLVKNLSNDQLTIANNFLGPEFKEQSNLEDQIVEFITNLFMNTLKEKTSGLDLEKVVSQLTYGFGIYNKTISDSNLLPLPENIVELIKIWQNTLNNDLRLIISHKNAKSLGEALVGYAGYEAFLSVKNFYSLKEKFEYILDEEPVISFAKLSEENQYIFLKSAAQAVKIEPRVYDDWEEVADKLFFMMKKNNLKIIKNRQPGIEEVFYIPS